MSLIIKNGQIVTASDVYSGDIYIEGEKICATGKLDVMQAATVIEARGKLIFPGGIDPHVHLDLPFMGTNSSDDYESGTRAALFGGTTTVIDFANQVKGGTLHDALQEWRKKGENNAFTDYAHHMVVTDINNRTRRELKDMIEKEGVSSFKTFMAYKGTTMLDDGQMLEVMEEVKNLGGLVMVHATNGDIIDHLIGKYRSQKKLSPRYHYQSQPEFTEVEATGRFIDMAQHTGVPSYIVHMSSAGALNKVREATLRNQKVHAETCIQYLLLDASLYNKDFEGAKWVMSPPLRLQKDREALWSGLNQGLVQVVGTDHCPFTWAQKKIGKNDFTKIPNGHPAIEHRVELMYSEGVVKGRISLNKFVDVTSTRAAKLFGMFPQKGTIAAGSDADLVIFDPEENHTLSVDTHHHNCDYSCYEGWKVKGKVKTVLLRGQIAIDGDQIKIKKGYGRFIKRKPIL